MKKVKGIMEESKTLEGDHAKLEEDVNKLAKEVSDLAIALEGAKAANKPQAEIVAITEEIDRKDREL